MIRLFAGLAFPPDLAERLETLSQGLAGARRVAARNLHLTLRFMGEVDETTAQDIHDELAAIRTAGFRLTLAGFGLFGDSRRAHTLWLGVEQSPPLAGLAARVETAVQKAGLTPEPRRFTPHVTLARIKGTPDSRLRAFIAGAEPFRQEGVTVAHFALFESVLGRSGAEYFVLERYPLGLAEA